MNDLDKLFTIATSTDEDGPLYLLFSSLSFDTNILNAGTMTRIVNDPLFQKLMFTGAVLWHTVDENNYPLIVATNDISDRLLSVMDTVKENDCALVYSPPDNIHQIDLHKTFYECTRPERTIIGCVGCGQNGISPHDCVVKKLTHRYFAEEEEGAYTPADAVTLCKSRKTNIADFTFISPRLTASEHFEKRFRTMDEHDFSIVEERSQEVKRGLRERGRRKRFEKEVCSTCLVQDQYCDGSTHCEGPFDHTELEAAEIILNKVTIPFTDKEIITLLGYSGELNHLYNRCIYWATFTCGFNNRREELRFILRRRTNTRSSRDDIQFSSFKDAMKILREYGDNANSESIKKAFPKNKIDQVTKALLVELASKNWSPTYRNGWRKTEYSTLGLEFYPHSKKFELTFRHTHRGRPLPWTLTAKHFRDIYHNYGHFSFLGHTNHPLNHYNFHRGK